jgi:hypothetical protein
MTPGDVMTDCFMGFSSLFFAALQRFGMGEVESMVQGMIHQLT